MKMAKFLESSFLYLLVLNYHPPDLVTGKLSVRTILPFGLVLAFSITDVLNQILHHSSVIATLLYFNKALLIAHRCGCEIGGDMTS